MLEGSRIVRSSARTLWLAATLALLADAGSAGTGKQLSPWMNRAPTIDGVLWNAEWREATEIGLGVGVQLWLGNDARTLYLGVVDTNDSTLGADDALLLYFDDEGGTAPKLDDDDWTVLDCQNAPDLGEGSLVFRHDQSVAYQERSQNGACAPLFTLAPRAGFVVGLAPDGLTYEIAIPLDGPMPLRAGGGQRFGVSLRLLRNGVYVACFPADCDNPPLVDWRNLVLASIGCNTEAQGFGGGLPQVGLPLDWESTYFGVGQGWGQSTVFADPVFCQENVTGGGGAAACVADALQGGGEAESLLAVPIRLTDQTTAKMRLRAHLEEGTNGAGLRFGYRRQDATIAFPLSWYEYHAGESIEIDLAMTIGNLPVELAFDYLTQSAGEEGGFAEIDDVELLCGPLLFADGFESRLTTHWSATTP